VGSDRREVWREVKDALRLERLSPLVVTASELAEEAVESPNFGFHLLHEGQVVFQRRKAQHPIKEMVATSGLMSVDLSERRRAHENDLLLFADPDRYSGHLELCVAGLYRLGRTIAILRLLERGQPDYDWRSLFDRLATLEPSLAESARLVGRSKPPPVSGQSKLIEREERVVLRQVEALYGAVGHLIEGA